MNTRMRQSLITIFVVVAIAYISITILSRSLHYPVKELELASAIPASPEKPNVFADESIGSEVAPVMSPKVKLKQELVAAMAEQALQRQWTAPPVAENNPAESVLSQQTTPEPVAATTAVSVNTTPSLPAVAPAQVANAHGWMVRVGTFAQKQLAAKIISELSDQGYTVHSQETISETSKKPLTVVYVGPESSQTDADDLRAELQVMEDLQGKVVYIK